LIEILVVIVIIGLIAALLIPAVQSAREAVRRSRCASNLKQMAMAVHQYHSTYQKLPMGEMPGAYSPNVAILPFIDQSVLYNTINFVVLNQPGRGPGGKKATIRDPMCDTAGRTVVGAYICPSEIYSGVSDPSWTTEGKQYWAANYAWNSGTWWPRTRSWDGLFGRTLDEAGAALVPPDPPLGSIDFAACTDGLSGTLLLAEVANGPVATTFTRTRVSDCYQIPYIQDGASIEATIRACDAVDWRTGSIPWDGRWRYKGYPWTAGNLWLGWFNTIRTPNQTCCSDARGNLGVTRNVNHWWFILKPSSSYHTGVVNVALADGSVKTIKESIDRALWMGLSTRAGGEVISANAY